MFTHELQYAGTELDWLTSFKIIKFREFVLNKFLLGGEQN